MISQKNFHTIFSLDSPKTFLRLVDSEEWFLESQLYSFVEDDFSTALYNVLYNLTLVCS
jgi:hypothetical protein